MAKKWLQNNSNPPLFSNPQTQSFYVNPIFSRMISSTRIVLLLKKNGTTKKNWGTLDDKIYKLL